MTLRARFALSLLTIAIALLVPLLLAVRSVQRVQTQLSELRAEEFESSLALGQLREELNELRLAETRMFALRSEQTLNRMKDNAQSVAALTNKLDSLRLRDEARDLRRELGEINSHIELEFELAQSGQWDAADSLSINFVTPAIERAVNAVREAEVVITRSTTDRVKKAESIISTAQMVSIASLAIALFVATIVAVSLTRSVQQPVAELERGMEAVAAGDFGTRLHLDASRPDEFGRLATSFQTMSRQLAELDKLKAEFVSIASHELKTPINVIIGYLELLGESIYGPVTPKQQEVVRVVQAQAHTLARLAKQLLDVSRFEAGGGKLEPRPLPLARLLDELEAAFHVLAVQRGVRFAVTRGDGLPEEVVWDPDRVNEVLGNLLSNAFKFTERGGEVELQVDRAGELVHLEVRDSGAGIPADQLPRVFDKFYQADNQRHSSLEGTGLGLAIAKGIVEAHGGTISVDSAPGMGTTFQITMPIAVTTGRRTPLREAAHVAQSAV